MKPTRWIALVAMLCAVSARATNPQPPIVQDPKGLVKSAFAPNADFLGNSRIGRVEVDTPTLQGVLIASGSGLVYGVDNSSGTAGDLCLVMDTITVPAVTGAGIDTKGVRISPNVLSGGNSATGCTSSAACESWNPIRGSRFATGIVLIRKGTSNCQVRYRLDADNVVSPPTK